MEVTAFGERERNGNSGIFAVCTSEFGNRKNGERGTELSFLVKAL